MTSTKYSLEYIRELINENNPEKAMDMLNHVADKSMWFENARAVCLMRLGLFEDAVRILASFVYPNNSVVIDMEVPVVIRLNLAEAMLLSGNVAGAVTLLQSTREDCPVRNKLETAIRKWKRAQPFWSRIVICLSILPYNKPVSVELPFGQP